MAAKNKKKRNEKRTKQFTLLEYQKSSSTGGNVPLVIDLDDDDPYKFVGTQSLEIETEYTTPKRPPGKKPATPQGPRGDSSSTLKDGGNSQLKQTTPKTKKSPGSSVFTESERLRLKEEEEYKRAIEASLQDQQRENRIRRRKEKEEENEQNEIYQSIQKELKKAKPIITDAESHPTVSDYKSISSEDEQEQTADVDRRHSQNHSVSSSRMLSSSQQLKSVSVKKLSIKTMKKKMGDAEQLEAIKEVVTAPLSATTTAETPMMCTTMVVDTSVTNNDCMTERNKQDYDVQVISGDEDATPPLSGINSELFHDKPVCEGDDHNKEQYFEEMQSMVVETAEKITKTDADFDTDMDVTVECTCNVDVSKRPVSMDSSKSKMSVAPNKDQSNTTASPTEDIKITQEYKPVKKNRSNLLRLAKDRKRGIGVSYQEENPSHVFEEPSAKRQRMEADPDPNKNKPSIHVEREVENKELDDFDSKGVEVTEQSLQDCSIVDSPVTATYKSPHKVDNSMEQKQGGDMKSNSPKKGQELFRAGKNTPKKPQLSLGQGVRKQLKLSSTSVPQLQQRSSPPSKLATLNARISTIIASLPSSRRTSMYPPNHMISDFSNDSTPKIVQKFDSYFSRLAGAQRQVLLRLKWGEPVAVSTRSSNSLAVDRSHRVLRSNVDYPLSALKLRATKRKPGSSLRNREPSPMYTCSISDNEETSSVREIQNLGDDADTNNDDMNAATLAQDVCTLKEKSDEEMDTRGEEEMSSTVHKDDIASRVDDVDVWNDAGVNEESGQELTAMSPSTHAPDNSNPLADDPYQWEDITENQEPIQPTKNDKVKSLTTTSKTVSYCSPVGSDSDIDFDDFMELPSRPKKARDQTDPLPPSTSTLSRSPVSNAQGIPHNDVIVISTQSDAPVLPPPARNSAFDQLLSQRRSISPDPAILSDHVDSESDDISVPTNNASTSKTWLSSRNVTIPVTSRKKAPANRNTKNKNQKTSSKGNGKKRSTKSLSAAARMRTKSAQVNDDNCTSDTMSSMSEEDTPVIRTKLNHKRHSKQFSALNNSSDEEVVKRDSRPKQTTLSERTQPRRGTGKGGKNKSKKGSVIDLTADTQITMDSSPSPSPSEELVECPMCQKKFTTSTIQAHASHCNPSTKSKDKNNSQCPMCSKWFDVKTIQVHAEQCSGMDSDEENDSSAHGLANNTRTSSSTVRGQSSAVVRGKSVWQKRYQPSLSTLIGKQMELDDIEESSETETEGERMEGERNDGQHKDDDATKTPLLNELEAALDESKQGDEDATNTPLFGQLDAAFESTYSKQTREVNPDTTSTDDFQAIPCPDGGYMIDPSTVSSSPVRTFKRISELDPKERESFQNQFSAKGGKRRGGKQSHRGHSNVMSREERNSSTWGRDDFDSLLESGQGKSGHGRGGQWHGSSGGSGRKTAGGRSYGWKWRSRYGKQNRQRSGYRY